MNPSTSLGTRSNVGMAKPSPPVRQAGNIWRLLVIHRVCRRSVPRGCPQVKYRCRCRGIGQPNHRRPPPAEPPLRPMAWDMPVQDLRQAHLDHLPDEEGHIVDTLGDDHQVSCPKDLLGLLRQLHSHGTLLPKLHMLWREHSNGTPWAQRAVDSKLQAPQKSAFGLFVRRMGRSCYPHLFYPRRPGRMHLISFATSRLT